MSGIPLPCDPVQCVSVGTGDKLPQGYYDGKEKGLEWKDAEWPLVKKELPPKNKLVYVLLSKEYTVVAILKNFLGNTFPSQ